MVKLDTHAKLIIHQYAVKSAVEVIRAKIAQQVYIIEECKFLVSSKILSRSNKACYREEVPLGSLGSTKLAGSDS